MIQFTISVPGDKKNESRTRLDSVERFPSFFALKIGREIKKVIVSTLKIRQHAHGQKQKKMEEQKNKDLVREKKCNCNIKV